MRNMTDIYNDIDSIINMNELNGYGWRWFSYAWNDDLKSFRRKIT